LLHKWTIRVIRDNNDKVYSYVATSIDGYIARPDGSIDLPSPEVDAEYDGYAKFYDSIDALVMGSMTYEQVLGFEMGIQANFPMF